MEKVLGVACVIVRLEEWIVYWVGACSVVSRGARDGIWFGEVRDGGRDGEARLQVK